MNKKTEKLTPVEREARKRRKAELIKQGIALIDAARREAARWN